MVSAMLSGLVSSRLPGPGTIIQSINISLIRPIKAGDVIKANLEVKDKNKTKGTVTLSASCYHHDDELIAEGKLEVIAPEKKVPIKERHSLDTLLSSCKKHTPVLTGVVWPMSQAALKGAIESKELIQPVLYGSEKDMKKLAEQIDIDISDIQFVASSTAEEAALKAAKDAGMGKLKALMKGSLHTDILLHAVLQKEANLKTGRLLSHCALISAPTYPERIVLSDIALNITPDVNQKKDICLNAIDFAQAMGINKPKLALLAAVETINTKMSSTLDAAIIAKMADRGQITGATLDGPLDFDAAIDKDAARIKNIKSPVAGVANILIVPNIEAGNMIYKQFDFIADAQTAGLVVGARVPIILTSRADTADQRKFSAAAALLYAHHLELNLQDNSGSSGE